MATYCLSDLHLHDDEQPYLFTAAKEKVFVALAAEADRAGATLLFAGDVLDLTGMQPPARGLARFFEAALGGAARPPREAERSVEERVAAVAARFSGFFGALAPFAAAERLRFLLGNHDVELNQAAGRAALARALRIPVEKLHFSDSASLEDGVFVSTHGHQWDEANRTPGHAARNPGAALTAVLYHALLPALQALGVAPRIAYAVPAVRPEEQVIDGLEQIIGDGAAVERLLVAFVTLLHENGYFRDDNVLERLAITVAEHGVFTREVISPARVKAAMRDDGAMKQQLAAEAQKIRALTTPTPRVVAMGHTHDFDGGAPAYVNLGTWIDHVTGLDEARLAAADRSLPVLLVDGAGAAVYDASHLPAAGALAACPRMWASG